MRLHRLGAAAFVVSIALACTLSAPVDVWAKPAKQQSAQKKQSADGGPLGFVSGLKAGTYMAIAKDIAGVAKQSGVTLDVKTSDGSIDNIRRINSSENAGLGIVQSDVLGFLGRSQNPETMKMASNLRMVLPLYREEVHVLARGGIVNFSDLQGKRVIIGEDGSGHMLTAVNLLSMMSITPGEIIKQAAPEGIVTLMDKKADAMIFVGGKPVKLFKNMDAIKADKKNNYASLMSELHFVPLTDTRMLEEYQPAEITHADYDFVPKNMPVSTVSVTAVLVAFDYSEQGSNNAKRCAQVKRVADAIRKNEAALKSKGHPKWKEISLSARLPIWKQDSCSATVAGTATTTKQGRDNLGRDLIKVIEKSH